MVEVGDDLKMVAYLTVLNITQPSRIQDVRAHLKEYLPINIVRALSGDELGEVHKKARELGYIIAVRRGVYSVTFETLAKLHSPRMGYKIDNQRLFLMKSARKRLLA